MDAGGEVGTDGLGEAELPELDPKVFEGLHARKAAQVVLKAIKTSVQVEGNARATAKLRGKYCAQFAAAMREASSRF